VRDGVSLTPIFAREDRHRKRRWRREQIAYESAFHAVYSTLLLYGMALKKSGFAGRFEGRAGRS